MKKNKFKSKKGMTLIEVIISVTLLSILIVPLSSIVISSVKNSKDGEYRQKASYIGQKVIEELKSYDYLKLDSEGSFKLLDGDKITKNTLENNFKGTFERTIFGAVDEENRPGETKFNVEVTMKKSEDFNFDNINKIDESKVKYKVTFEKDASGYSVYISNKVSEKLIVTEDLVININENNLEIYNKSNDKIKISAIASEGKDNSLLIDVKNTYDKSTNIILSNNVNNLLEIYLLKDSDLNNIKINSYKGNVILSELNNDLNNIANMYTYEVVVKDKNEKVLFKGSSSSNIVIK